ncbi:hypothetical protein GCM10009839_82600 [Catenulispora yoronensis]|uniref:Uncharacterized protein n=1 Tax=Catenulispora yoronensis TaxID=450799 RepID=A0ABP5GZD1_9ACTN
MSEKPGILELRTRISRVNAEGREYRVVRPDRPAPRLVLIEHDRWLDGFADQAAIKQLATLWALASGSPRSLIYLPMRQNKSPYEDGRRLDLVLAHHSLQFRPSRWTAVRAKLGTGDPHTVRIPDPGTPELDYSRHWHAENRDVLFFDNAADTLFVSGSRESFHRAAVAFRKLLLDTATDHRPPQHACAEIDSGRWPTHALNRTRHGTPARLHVQYQAADW